jgi:hypothetical protein
MTRSYCQAAELQESRQTTQTTCFTSAADRDHRAPFCPRRGMGTSLCGVAKRHSATEDELDYCRCPSGPFAQVATKEFS